MFSSLTAYSSAYNFWIAYSIAIATRAALKTRLLSPRYPFIGRCDAFLAIMRLSEPIQSCEILLAATAETWRSADAGTGPVSTPPGYSPTDNAGRNPTPAVDKGRRPRHLHVAGGAAGQLRGVA